MHMQQILKMHLKICINQQDKKLYIFNNIMTVEICRYIGGGISFYTIPACPAGGIYFHTYNGESPVVIGWS